MYLRCGLCVCVSRYDQAKILTDVVAERTGRLDLEIQASDGGAWRKVGQQIRGAELDLGAGFAAGCAKLDQDTFVKANDRHYDAMLWPHVHPYGTGSSRCEPGTTTLHKYLRNRAMTLQQFFRRSSLWAFWALDRLIKQRLFFCNWARRQKGMRIAALNPGDDAFTRTR